jgi:outer membrane protein OmpA-like peptidoglycan-associated protein
MEANGKVGYYSSIRKEGHGEKDIYRINFSSPENENKDKILLKVVVIDKENSQDLEAEIEITDLETNKTIATLNSNSLSGEFLVSLQSGKNYGIYVNKENYLFYSDNMNIPDTASYNEIIKTILLQKLIEGSKIILNNVFYDYDKYNLTINSISELNRLYDLLIKNPTLKIEISAHTDSRGSDDFNNKLSQQRAQVCVDYLLQKDVNNDRIIAKGYGKQQLLINDAEIANLKSEAKKEAAHQQNRRTEFKIIEK